MKNSMHRILLVTVGALLVSTAGHFNRAIVSDRPHHRVACPRYTRATASGAAPALRAVPRMLAGTRPNVLATIQGNALDSTNGRLPNTQVRLRDARLGRILESQISDKSGLFEFKGVGPGQLHRRDHRQRSDDSRGEPDAQRERGRGDLGRRQAAVPHPTVCRPAWKTPRPQPSP